MINNNQSVQNPEFIKNSNSRNLGIELFRIISMIMIVLLHVLGRGGIYPYAEHLSTNYKIAWFLETAAYCSVNCYALISGYVNLKSNFKFRKIVYLWLEVFFITVSTTSIFSIFGQTPVTKDKWMIALFPLTKKEYWYFNAYALLFFFIPILNKGILSLTKRQHLTIMASIFFLTSILPFVGDKELFSLGGGYSCIWLMILYVFGAYFRLYGIPKFAKPILCFLSFFLFTLIAWWQKIGLELSDPDEERAGDLISYTSPCMVIMAVSLLLLFAQVKIKTNWGKFTISWLGKSSFGVFLVHVGTMVWGAIDGHWAKYANAPTWKMLFVIFSATISMYIICSAYSIVRILIFKHLHIHEAVDKISDFFNSKLEKTK